VIERLVGPASISIDRPPGRLPEKERRQVLPYRRGRGIVQRSAGEGRREIILPGCIARRQIVLSISPKIITRFQRMPAVYLGKRRLNRIYVECRNVPGIVSDIREIAHIEPGQVMESSEECCRLRGKAERRRVEHST